MSSQRRQYEQYLQSSQWWQIRERKLTAVDYRCEFRPIIGEWDRKTGYPLGERCTATKGLQAHHRNYNHLGAECDEDLEVLCRRHHLVRHIVNSVCEVCGATLYSEDATLDLIEEHSDTPGLPTLDQIGLGPPGSDYPLLCWDCSDNLWGR